MTAGRLQVSGRGLKLEPFAASDTAVREGDLDGRTADDADTSELSTHWLYPSTLSSTLLSGAFTHTLPSSQTPSLILWRTASSE